MKFTGRSIAWFVFMGIAAGNLLTSCTFAEEIYLYGECSEDADLRRPYNYYEGASCVNGRAQCPEGQTFCQRIANFEDGDRVIETCLGPCIECPGHGGACMDWDRETQEFSYLCADSFADCWQNQYFLVLKGRKEGCALMTEECW